MNITKGVWGESVRFGMHIESTDEINMSEGVADVSAKHTLNETNANIILIVDAGNTAQKCGLLPSELLEQRDELLKSIQEVRADLFYQIDAKFGSEKASKYPSIIKAEKAIKKATS